MAEKKKDPCRIVIEGRVSFPKVYKAEAFEDQQPKFSAVCLVKKKFDLTPVRKALFKAKVKQWGEDKAKWPKNLLSPIKDGDEMENPVDGYEGHWAISASNKLRPNVVNGQLEPITEESDEFYAGCYAKFALRAYAWEFKSKKGVVLKRGVSFSLESLQKTAEGERFSGRPSVEDTFDKIEDNDGGDDDSSDDGDEDGGF